MREIPTHLKPFVLDMPAVHGRTVMQGHGDVCKILGHGRNELDGVEQGTCPRCGANTGPLGAREGSTLTDVTAVDWLLWVRKLGGARVAFQPDHPNFAVMSLLVGPDAVSDDVMPALLAQLEADFGEPS